MTYKLRYSDYSTTTTGPPDGVSGDSIVNVLDHGAKGDGVTDDRAAIQTALGFHLNGMIYIPPSPSGQPYIIKAPGLTIYGQTTIIIDGYLKLANGANGGVLNIPSGSSQITIGGHGVVDANGTNQTVIPGHCLYASGSSVIRISGITLQNALNWNMNVVNCANVRVDNVQMLNCGSSNEFASGSNDCWLTNCLIDGVTDLGFAFYGGVTNSGAMGNTIRHANINPAFPGSGQNGIGLLTDSAQNAPCSNIVIADNIIHDCSGGGIYCDSSVVGVRHKGITIANNRCFNNGRAANGQTMSDIGCNHCENTVFIGNQSYNFGSATVTAYGLFAGSEAIGTSFIGNQAANVGQGTTSGVGLFVDFPNLLLASANHFFDTQTTPTMASAISGTAGLENTYHGNFCDTASVALALQPDTGFFNIIKGKMVMRNLPMAATGLGTGTVWQNGTVLNIV